MSLDHDNTIPYLCDQITMNRSLLNSIVLYNIIYHNKAHVVHFTIKFQRQNKGLCNINNVQATLVFR